MTRSLFDPEKLPQAYDLPREAIPARATDPETSVEAAKRHIASGKAGAHRMIVLRLVAANNGSTYVELHAAQPEPRAIDHVEVMRRLNDLFKLCLVEKGPERPCRVNRNRMTTWRITERGWSELRNQS